MSGANPAQNFQVDLTGMVNLLSKHLYSGPQVYIRELLQNGMDAITAARELNVDFPELLTLRVLTAENTLEASDTGIGLSAHQAGELLATIGRSSKRDAELGFGRAEFLGQFGIGMLAAFMVADEITVLSQSRVPDADGGLPAPIRWVGKADGTFVVTETTSDSLPAAIREGGSLVRLTARKDTANWVSPRIVEKLARNYGELLPLNVQLTVVGAHGEEKTTRLTRPLVPWQESYISPELREVALKDYCKETFGFTPLATIDLEVPALGITGAAFVLPQAVAPGSGQHRVYLKQMLLGERVDKILPEWAFFVRAVIDTDSLAPTASREQLHEDDSLLAAREALGLQLINWIRDILENPSPLALKFLETHALALKAVAVQEEQLLELIAATVPFETTAGAITLKDAYADDLLFTSTVEDFKRAAAVARAAGLTVVNCGYAYDTDLLNKLHSKLDWQVRELVADDLSAALTAPDVEREIATAAALAKARDIFEDHDCDVILRAFEPSTMPAMLLFDREAAYQQHLRAEHEAAPDMWDGLLGNLLNAGKARSRTLVLNDNAEVVHTLLQHEHADTFEPGLVALYVTAVAQSGEGLRSGESHALSAALNVLLRKAIDNNSES